MTNLILIGAQGSGKGTQAQALATRLHVKPCASGDLLREAMAKGTPNGLAAKPFYDRGDLVPDEIVVGMILDGIAHVTADADGVILDGFPRTKAQAEALDKGLVGMGQSIGAVIYLDVPREMLLDRLEGRWVCEQGHVWNVKTKPPKVPGICDYDGTPLFQRSDDTPEKIVHRLDIFFNETIQLVDYYRARGKLVHVDGKAAPERVTEAVLRGLGALGVLGGHGGAQPGGRAAQA